MVCTRMDLIQAVNVVSEYMGNPRNEHWQPVKCIFKYLKGTTNIGLIYHGDTSFALTDYSNFDYVVDLDARRFVTRYAFMINNFLVSWKATLQPTVALYTTKVEYVALAEATKEGIWLKGLITKPFSQGSSPS